MPDRDVTERAKDSLNVFEHCRAAGVTPASYPETLIRELLAEVVRLRALLNPVENWHGVVKGNNG